MTSNLRRYAKKSLETVAANAEAQHRLRTFAHRLHLREDGTVRIFDRIHQAMARSEDILASLDDDKDVSGQNFLFWTMKGSVLHGAIEGMLAYALKLRGADVSFVVCDEFLPACDARGISHYPGLAVNGETSRQICDRCFFRSRSIFDAFRLPYVSLSDLVPAESTETAKSMTESLSRDEIFNLEYRGIALGDDIRASVVRFFRHTDPAHDDATEQVIRDFGASAVMLTDGAYAAFDRTDNARLMTSTGLYVNWGVVTDVAKRLDVPIVTYRKGFAASTLRLGHDGNLFDELNNEPRHYWADLPLTPDRRDALHDRVGRRWEADSPGVVMRNGERSGVTLYKDAITDVEETRRLLELDPSKPVLGLYPNVGWDSQIDSQNIAFPDMFEWIIATVAFFEKHPELQLVVRSHPVERFKEGVTYQLVTDEIAKRYPVLPPNVRVIPPESKISSYTIARFADAGAVHGTEFGLELAYAGKPVLVTGGPPFRGKGFTHDVETADEYFSLLSRFHELPPPTAEQVELAQKYAYHFYFRRELPFKFIEGAGLAGLRDVHLDSLSDLAPGQDVDLDFILDGILERTPFLTNPVLGEAETAI